MPSINICLVLLLVHLSVFSFSIFGDPIYWAHFCSPVSGTTVFVANRNKLVSSLSNATSHDGFYNTSVGRSPNTVHGLFLCRGDLIPENCQNCIDVVAADVVQRCPNQTGAVIWYDECMLHYSDQYIFSSMEVAPYQVLWYDEVDVGEPDRFNRLRETLLKDIATLASKPSLGAKKFATKEANYARFHTLYSLAQCTPDISGEDCYSCLRAAITYFQFCCSEKPALALYPSCTLQYNITPFYQQSNRTAEALSPELPPPPLLLPSTLPGKRGMSLQGVIKIAIPAISFLVFSSFFCCVLGRKARKKIIARKRGNDGSEAMAEQSGLQIDLSMIETATNNFAEVNKIGAGGFGSVYKGILPNGQEIAVKRLSRSSGQGAQEFQNEVSVVAKLQHRNLVKLLGYCLERTERMLIYEFVPNKSLDSFIFDPEKQRPLDWPKRYKIIKGIARGLLYLHSDSRLKIIHRDLKAGNILLDEDMTPKISDFGMAKIFGENKSQERTRRIVGTFGYMPPEYAIHGRFSEKSDVFSFGILMLEIVSGKRNTSFCHSQYAENLLTYAWRHWRDGTSMELMDSTLQDSYVSNEVLRSIHIGLLCVQENPDARPTMARVALMLSSSSVSLPSPQKIAFFFGTVTGTPELPIVEQRSYQSTTSSTQASDQFAATATSSSATVNEASITAPFPR